MICKTISNQLVIWIADIGGKEREKTPLKEKLSCSGYSEMLNRIHCFHWPDESAHKMLSFICGNLKKVEAFSGDSCLLSGIYNGTFCENK